MKPPFNTIRFRLSRLQMYLLLPIYLLIFPKILLCENPTSPLSLPKNYVTDAFKSQNAEQKESVHQQTHSSSDPDLAYKDTTNTLVPKTIKDKSLTDSLQVNRISAILNASNTDHFQKKFNQLYKLAVKHNLKVGSLYYIQPSKEFMKSYQISMLFMKLWILGGQPIPLSDVPPEYSFVSLSPTWIIETPQGTIILEAPDELSSYFTKEGRYILNPQLSLDAIRSFDNNNINVNKES